MDLGTFEEARQLLYAGYRLWRLRRWRHKRLANPRVVHFDKRACDRIAEALLTNTNEWKPLPMSQRKRFSDMR